MGVIKKISSVEKPWTLVYDGATDDIGVPLEFKCRPLVHADLASINIPGHGGLPILGKGRDLENEPLSQEEQTHFLLYMAELVRKSVIAIKDDDKWVKVKWSDEDTEAHFDEDNTTLVMHVNTLQRLAGMRSIVEIGGLIIRHINFGGRMEPFAAQGFRQEGLPNGGEDGEGVREVAARDNVAD